MINEAIEKEFNHCYGDLKFPIKLDVKYPITWSSKNPLHFFQSLAFVLQSETIPHIAVSSFEDKKGETKLYIATNEPMNETQKSDITDIINLFLDLKPAKEIEAKVLPRMLHYIVKQFGKMNILQLEDFRQDFPGELANTIEDVFMNDNVSLDDAKSLIILIKKNKKALYSMKNGQVNCNKWAKRVAHRVCKMIKIVEEIKFVLKMVKRHQQDKSIKSLTRPFQFISLNCHAELAILKTAKDVGCGSQTLFIGVSRRPCFCCSFFVKSVIENKSVNFAISIAESDQKLYGNWKKIENCFETEFNQVWARVLKIQSGSTD